MPQTKSTISRQERASRIVEQGVVVELAEEPGLYVVVDLADNRKAHLASIEYCSCKDHEFRGVACSHILAIRKKLNVGTCSQCGSYTHGQQYYIGGRGYVYFDVCSGDGSHYSKEHGVN